MAESRQRKGSKQEWRGREAVTKARCGMLSISHVPPLGVSSQGQLEEGDSHETTDNGLPTLVSEDFDLLPSGLALLSHWGLTLERGMTRTQGSDANRKSTLLKAARWSSDTH